MTSHRHAVAADALRSLGADVWRVRVERGVTQTQVAYETNLAPSTISLIERGLVSTSVERAARLLDWIARYDGTSSPTDALERERGSPLLRSTTTIVTD